ncbi:gp53-like domain-containing protein [Escherichia coli]
MALQLLAANNAQSVLAAGISASATSLTLNTGTGALFPSPVSGTSFFKLTLIDAATGSLTEIVHVTARAGDVFTIQRGQEGTVPRAWSANDIAANMMTAGTLSYILGNFQPLDPTLTALAALVGVANKLPYFNGDDTAALTDLTQVGRDIIGKSTIADILTYLGLGEAAKRDVGTGENQIPDINSFLSVTGAAGYQKLPSGLIIQWGSATAGVGATGNTGNAINFSVSFPNICHQVVVSYDNGGGKVVAGAAGSFTKTNFLMRCDATSGVYVFRWFAIGS